MRHRERSEAIPPSKRGLLRCAPMTPKSYLYTSMKKAIPAIIPALFFALSCSDTPKVNNEILLRHSQVVQHIFFNDDSLLHGISLGMKKEDVKKLALPGDSLGQEEPNYLLFEGKIDSAKHYTWDCEFDSAGLFALTLDIYLTDEESAEEWYTDLTAYFSEKYGPATDDGMAMTWEVKKAKRPARIELIEDTEYPYGQLHVYYYDLTFIPEQDTLPMDSLFLLDAM